MRLHYGDCTIPFALPEEIKNCQIWTEHSLQANMSNKNAANETIMQFKCNAFDYVLDPESLLITVRTPI